MGVVSPLSIVRAIYVDSQSRWVMLQHPARTCSINQLIVALHVQLMVVRLGCGLIEQHREG